MKKHTMNKKIMLVVLLVYAFGFMNIPNIFASQPNPLPFPEFGVTTPNSSVSTPSLLPWGGETTNGASDIPNINWNVTVPTNPNDGNENTGTNNGGDNNTTSGNDSNTSGGSSSSSSTTTTNKTSNSSGNPITVSPGGGSGSGGAAFDLDTILGFAKDFFGLGKSDDDDFASEINEELQGIINVVVNFGNLIIFIVAVVLGVKYIWSGVDGKMIVKETLPSFCIGVTFFYFAQKLVDFFKVIGTDIQNTTSSNAIIGTIWNTTAYLIQIACIGGIIFLGLKYMWSPADKRADFKNQAVMLVLGLILVLSAVEFINFILGIGNALL